MRKQNSYCLKEKLHSELYAEIDRMEPVFRHLLEAQLRGKAKEGMSYLRQSVSPSSSTRPQKPAHDLDGGRGGKTFYEWLDPQKRSTIRLCMHWQASSVLLLIALVKYDPSVKRCCFMASEVVVRGSWGYELRRVLPIPRCPVLSYGGQHEAQGRWQGGIPG